MIECPRWDSNPHCRRFELRSSAGWDTGTGPPNRIPTTLSRAETGMPVRDWSRGESGVTDGREAAPTRRRVLIAEDEALIRLDLREMLIEEGYDVVGEAGDGEAALRLAEQLRPDLVILDIKMPIMDGLTAAENIANSRLAPVVILTAFS